MGTRCGDIDATILEYLMDKYGYDIKENADHPQQEVRRAGHLRRQFSDFRDLESAAAQEAITALSWPWTTSTMR